ncbi:hypothetical protein DB32_005691 [Sandaracinus amylolyticus]|uniref:Abnormal spindle-like microcephaly-associated protein ASH domain-containing protein n=2 Tax=Sandaracinus amylolyticus TaxID=927083 RepID=A0A0F6W6C8_9BACT|nr:hypothetical protein DB32_005691 [Sandaracinus amylolyticus]
MALLGCAPTDTGNPPAALDANDVSAQVVSGIIEISYAITGAPGAVDPPEGEVWILELDQPRPVVRIAVAADGSFRRENLSARDGGRVRLWIEAPSGRSAPLDRVVTMDGLAAPGEALDTCVRLDPPDAIDVGDDERATLRIENGCSETVRLAPIALRDPEGAFEVVTDTSGTLAAGASETIEIALRAGDGALHVDALDVETIAPRVGRRGVTLIANAR